MAPFLGKEDSAISGQCFELPSEDIRFELDSAELLTPGNFFELEDTSATRFELPDAERSTSLTDEQEAKDRSDEVGNTIGQSEGEFHARYECPDDVGGDLSPISPISPINIKTFDRFPSLAPKGNESHRIPRKGVPIRLSLSESPTRMPPEQSSLPSASVPEGPPTFTYNYTAGPERPWRETLPLNQKARTIKELIDEISLRRHRISVRERDPGRFQPCLLPNLKHLTLTDIPSSTRQKLIPESLCNFIHELAEEEEIARLEYLRLYQDESEIPDYTHLIDGTLKLHRLVLEITPSNPSPLCMDRGPRRSFSSTEDYDSEIFIQASESDFSFFGEDDGGLLVSEGRIDGKMRVDNGLILETRGGEGSLVDVVGELVSFRREKKRAWEQAQRNGLSGVEQAQLGFWRGSVMVVKEAQ